MKIKYLFAKFSGEIKDDIGFLYIKPLFGKAKIFSHNGNPMFINSKNINWQNGKGEKLSLEDNIWLTKKFNFHVLIKNVSSHRYYHPWFFPPCPKPR